MAAKKFWTDDRLEEVRAAILPAHRTVTSAIKDMTERWGKFNRPNFVLVFTRWAGSPPKTFLATNLAQEEQTWPDDWIAAMRDEILPVCKTVGAALKRAKVRLGKVDRESFHRDFQYVTGYQPEAYLKRGDTDDPDVPAIVLESRITTMQKELDKVRKSAVSSQAIGELIRYTLHGAKDILNREEKWVAEPKRSTFHGMPVLIMSDIHTGEVVVPEQAMGNEYNLDICARRQKRVYTKTVRFYRDVLSSAEYPGIVVIYLGDNVSGNIHEELRRTNEIPIFPLVQWQAERTISGLDLLAEEFGRVEVIFVSGNHGRLGRKPTMKFGPQDNFEYALGQMVQMAYREDDRVNVIVSEAFEYHRTIQGVDFLLMHGHQIRGGVGISGLATPLALADHKRRKQTAAATFWTGQKYSYEYLLVGHFHQRGRYGNVLVNSSLIGPNEFSIQMGLPYELPQQSTFLVHPDHGLTIEAPIYGESRKSFMAQQRERTP